MRQFFLLFDFCIRVFFMYTYVCISLDKKVRHRIIRYSILLLSSTHKHWENTANYFGSSTVNVSKSRKYISGHVSTVIVLGSSLSTKNQWWNLKCITQTFTFSATTHSCKLCYSAMFYNSQIDNIILRDLESILFIFIFFLIFLF